MNPKVPEIAKGQKIEIRRLIENLNRPNRKKLNIRINYYEFPPEDEAIFRNHLTREAYSALQSVFDPIWLRDKYQDWIQKNIRDFLADLLHYCYLQVEEAQYERTFNYFGPEETIRIDMSKRPTWRARVLRRTQSVREKVLKLLTMKKINAAILMLLWVSTVAAKESAFNLYPPDYAETCKKYVDLTDKGLTVKAERLAENYRGKHIYPYFRLKSGEVRKIRILNPYGWFPENLETKYHLRQIEEDSSEGSDSAQRPSSSIVVKIRGADLEKWQDFILKNFSDSEPGESQKKKKQITEILISIKNSDYGSRSVVSDCFDLKGSAEFNISGWLGEEVILSGYKLANRKIIRDKEKPTGNSGSADENLKSEVKQSQKILAKNSTGSPIIDVILSQQPDRYEAVRAILRREPEQANGLAMSFKFTIYQSGKMEEQVEPTMYALNAAIRMHDFEMVKLLVENNASLCWNAHPVSGTSYCAVSYAAEFGTPEIHGYLKTEYRRLNQLQKKSVLYGSDISSTERPAACIAVADGYGYADGEAGKSQRKATKKICGAVKEFVDIK